MDQVPRDSSAAASPPPARGDWVAMISVFGLALVVRGAYGWSIHRSLFGTTLVGDARAYDAWARQILAGDWLGTEVFYQAPLYPYFLATVYRLLGPHLLAARIVQGLLGAAACALVVRAGSLWFGRRAGVAAGLLLACYPPQIFFDLLFQKTVLDTVWLAGLLVLLGEARRGESPPWWSLFCMGTTFGALALTRENALVLVLVLVPWILSLPGVALDRSKRIGLFLVGGAMILLPVVVRNFAVGGEFVLTTAQLGPNFYIGNHAGADGGYLPLRPGRGDARFERIDATELAESAIGRDLSPSEVSNYWLDQALAYIRSEPAEWLALMGRKIFLFWNGTEVVDTEGIEAYADQCAWFGYLALVFHFGVLLPLAVAGIIATANRARELWVLYGLILAMSASVILFYIFGRYRESIVPPLVLFSGAALTPAQWGPRRGARIALAALGAALAAALGNWPSERGPGNRAVTYYAHGKIYFESGRWDLAARCFEECIRSRPDVPDPRKLLGLIQLKAGRPELALEHLAVARQQLPNDPDVAFSYGIVSLARDNRAAAAASFRHAATLAPRRADIHAHLGRTLAELGKTDEALAALDEAERLAPPSSATHCHRAVALLAARRLDEARRHLDHVLRLEPTNPDALFQLGRLEQATGNWSAAEASMRQSIERWPGNLEARLALALLLYRRGAVAEAITELQLALRTKLDWPPALMALAWIRAAAEEARFRDGREALALARRALADQPPTAESLDLLAAAQAESGDFAAAAESARGALENVPATDADLRAAIGARRERYLAGRAARLKDLPFGLRP